MVVSLLDETLDDVLFPCRIMSLFSLSAQSNIGLLRNMLMMHSMSCRIPNSKFRPTSLMVKLLILNNSAVAHSKLLTQKSNHFFLEISGPSYSSENESWWSFWAKEWCGEICTSGARKGNRMPINRSSCENSSIHLINILGFYMYCLLLLFHGKHFMCLNNSARILTAVTHLFCGCCSILFVIFPLWFLLHVSRVGNFLWFILNMPFGFCQFIFF